MVNISDENKPNSKTDAVSNICQGDTASTSKPSSNNYINNNYYYC